MMFSTICRGPQVIVVVVIVFTLQEWFYIYGSSLGKLEFVIEFFFQLQEVLVTRSMICCLEVSMCL